MILWALLYSYITLGGFAYNHARVVIHLRSQNGTGTVHTCRHHAVQGPNRLWLGSGVASPQLNDYDRDIQRTYVRRIIIMVRNDEYRTEACRQ
ncbi:hypothetical protein K474DRAFT_1658283 [Panus rudis PR-1116 ss-1]|nr:hypothetical protein K474DRAFT_1658283 [Panus rudis PR-1116 ss-1]